MALNDMRFIEIRTADGIEEFDLENVFHDYYMDLDVSTRPFGMIFKDRNYSFDFFMDEYPQEKFRALNPSKDYVISEMLLKLDSHESTVMMSHEKEVYEIAEVLHPAYAIMQTGLRPEETRRFEIPLRTPVRIVDSDVMVEDGSRMLPYGFYHKLENPHAHDILVHITTIAEWELCLDKNGVPLKYGFNRPSNSWPSNLSDSQ